MRTALLLSLFLGLSSCYSFKGTSIPPDVETFYVSPFQNTAANVVATLSQTFTEALKDKIRSESRLTYTETDPHAEFSGAITRYRVTSVAPQPGETTAFNRLEIAVNIEYTNNRNPDENWTQSFSHFNDFDNTQNLLDIQDELIENINAQLTENIFNRAFANW